MLETGLGGALTQGFNVINDSMDIFMSEPAIYFVALALISAGTGVARKFVPMKRK